MIRSLFVAWVDIKCDGGFIFVAVFGNFFFILIVFAIII
jgi:hypothetical protein